MSDQARSLRILHVEDSKSDALFLKRYMAKGGISFDLTRVDTQPALREALECGGWDLLITDYVLPTFDGLAVVKMVRSIRPDLPCIIVSGQVGEEYAVEALRAGARDFISKSKLSRLIPAIHRELDESVARRIRRNLEHERFQQAAFLETLLETIPSPVYYKDAEGRFLGCNHAFEIHIGFPRKRLVGHTILDVMPTDQGAIHHAKDMELMQHPAVQIYQIESFQGGTRHYIKCFKAPFCDKEGRPLGVVGILLDVTDLVETQEALRLSEQRYRHIVEISHEGIVTTDGRWCISFANPRACEMFRIPPDQIIGLALEDLIPEEDRPDHRRRLVSRLEGKQESYERRFLRADGSIMCAIVSASPLLDEEGRFLGTLAMLTDITEWERAEQEKVRMEIQLRQAQKLEAIGQLAAGIAHEINTPIQYIGDNTIFLRDISRELLSYLDELRLVCTLDSIVDPRKEELIRGLETLDLDYLRDEIPKAIQQSLEGVARVSKIVSAMKEFSHPSMGVKNQVDLNHAIESTVTVCRNEWKYVADLELDLDPALPLVPCFADEFNQVVLNLIINAAQAIEAAISERQTSARDKIRISTRRRDQRIEIRVSDTGMGIPESIRDRIFDPFFTTKAVGKGTGQGLAIARAVIVDKHGGTIQVETDPGKGTTFVLTLPLEDAKGKP